MAPGSPLLFSGMCRGESEKTAILSEIKTKGKNLLSLIFGFLYSRLLKNF